MENKQIWRVDQKILKGFIQQGTITTEINIKIMYLGKRLEGILYSIGYCLL